MARKVTPMDVRLIAAVSGDSGDLNVAKLCREHGISRQSFYKWRRRFAAGGLEGLAEHSRAPRSSPRRVGVELENVIVGLRKELTDLGVDAGPGTIQWHLGRRKQTEVPSEATIWRVLVRRGFVVPEPRKRPKSTFRRFEAPAPNTLWQIDATKWVVGERATQIEIVNIIDDYSRVAAASVAVVVASCENAWEAFSSGVLRWGLPTGLLSDNGLAFSGRLRGFEVAFETNLRSAGVRAITSRPFHPQTCGKVERFQQTLKKWLRARSIAADLAELQTQLDDFVAYYNHERPHRGIGRLTPIERWRACPPVLNLGNPLPGNGRAARLVVTKAGNIEAVPFRINVGVTYTGHTAHVLLDDTHAAVFIDGRLVRHLELDHSRAYQPSGRRRGGTRQARLGLP